MGGVFGLGTASWSNYMLCDRASLRLTPTVGQQDEGRRSFVIGVSDHLGKVRVTKMLQVSREWDTQRVHLLTRRSAVA